MSKIKATYRDHMGSDLSVVNAARVSFGKSSEWVQHLEDHTSFHKCINTLSERDTSLIKYLASGMSSKDIEKWKTQMIQANDPDTVLEAYNALVDAEPHMSPFGHVFASFHVKAPIITARQLVKHKFLRWNEISRRYVEDLPEFLVCEFRKAVKDKKQGSGEYVGDEQQQATGDDFDTVQRAAVNAYMNALDEGVAPEQARGILPQFLMTEWIWSGSLDAFASMCKLRCKSDTQKETRLVADQISSIMKPLFPVSWEALMNH